MDEILKMVGYTWVFRTLVLYIIKGLILILERLTAEESMRKEMQEYAS